MILKISFFPFHKVFLQHFAEFYLIMIEFVFQIYSEIFSSTGNSALQEGQDSLLIFSLSPHTGHTLVFVIFICVSPHISIISFYSDLVNIRIKYYESLTKKDDDEEEKKDKGK